MREPPSKIVAARNTSLFPRTRHVKRAARERADSQRETAFPRGQCIPCADQRNSVAERNQLRAVLSNQQKSFCKKEKKPLPVPRQLLTGSIGRVSPHIEQVAVKRGAYRGLAVILGVLFILEEEEDGDGDISTKWEQPIYAPFCRRCTKPACHLT